MAGTAVRGRLTWQVGTVVELVEETSRTRGIALEVSGWRGHRAGQHVDVRLTADDGYQAQRSCSIASAPEDGHVVLTVERLDDGDSSRRAGAAAGAGSTAGRRPRWLGRRRVGR